MKKRSILNGVLIVLFFAFTGNITAQNKKPNILVIWGDDIGTWNISHNNRGMMGYRTPNTYSTFFQFYVGGGLSLKMGK